MDQKTKTETGQKLAHSPDEAARLLGISRTLLYAEWAAGRGPAWIKVGRRRLVSDTSLRTFLAGPQL